MIDSVRMSETYVWSGWQENFISSKYWITRNLSIPGCELQYELWKKDEL